MRHILVIKLSALGDFVLSGGEPAALALLDACVRLLPGVMGDEASLDEESFQAGLLEYPHYTRPERFRGLSVPAVLLGGHHARIDAWRLERRVEKTLKHRPDLLADDGLDTEIQRVRDSLRGTPEG